MNRELFDDHSKFAMVLAVRLVELEVRRTWVGLRYVRLGELLAVCSSLFETGGMLARAFGSKPAPFALAFWAGDAQREDAVDYMCGEVLQEIVPAAPDADSIPSLVATVEMGMWQRGIRAAVAAIDTDDWREWLVARADQRLKVRNAIYLAWLHSIQGAGFAIRYPDEFARLLAGTDSARRDGSYDQLRKVNFDPAAKRGASDGPLQDFTIHCRSYYPAAATELSI